MSGSHNKIGHTIVIEVCCRYGGNTKLQIFIHRTGFQVGSGLSKEDLEIAGRAAVGAPGAGDRYVRQAIAVEISLRPNGIQEI